MVNYKKSGSEPMLEDFDRLHSMNEKVTVSHDELVILEQDGEHKFKVTPYPFSNSFHIGVYLTLIQGIAVI